jgi:hypothetical protein
MSNDTPVNLAEFDASAFIFSKPKKYKNAEAMLCKIKNTNNEPILVQFPKMTLVSDFIGEPVSKFVELEFMNEKGYNKKVYNFLSKLDEFIISHVSSKSEEWFGKNIPNENISQMYNKFIKAPKTSENLCTVNFVFDKTKSQVIDKKNEELNVSELVKGVTLECIAQLKYLVFTKDTCFINWEIRTSKLHKKLIRVPKFGFVEDPEEHSDEESSDEENVTFF